jgi:MFS transporter, FHS family, Na+ dependent glucose transporter 1
MKNQKILVTAAYYLSIFAMGISMASLGPTLTGLAQNTQATIGAISILFTARALGSLAGSVLGGQVYDFMPGHQVMAVMILSMAVLTALTPFVPILWLLTAVLFITGAVQGILNIGGNALLVWVHGAEIGPFMNGLHFFFGVGTFITPIIIAQFIARSGSMVWMYLLLAVLILPTVAVAFLPSPTSPHKVQTSTPAKIDPFLIILIAAVFGCYSGASTAFGGWIFTYAIQMHLASPTNAAYLTSVFWGALTIGRLAAIPIAIRFKPQAILRADFFAALLSLIVMFFWPKSIIAVTITSVGLGFALASIYPTTMSLSGQIMPISGRITGLFSIGNSAGAMLIPWMIGQFFETRGPQSLVAVLGIDMLLALVILLVLARQIARPQVIPVTGSKD